MLNAGIAGVHASMLNAGIAGVHASMLNAGIAGVHASMSGAGGATGTIARGEAPQRGAQPRECRMPAKHAPRAADSLPYSHQIQFRRPWGLGGCAPPIPGIGAALRLLRRFVFGSPDEPRGLSGYAGRQTFCKMVVYQYDMNSKAGSSRRDAANARPAIYFASSAYLLVLRT